MSNASIDRRTKNQYGCEETWPEKDESRRGHNDKSCRDMSHHRPPRKSCVGNDILRLKISALTQELSQVHSLLNMLLVLVDPEDVKAALRLETATPTEDEWREIVADSKPPEELKGVQEEKPW